MATRVLENRSYWFQRHVRTMCSNGVQHTAWLTQTTFFIIISTFLLSTCAASSRSLFDDSWRPAVTLVSHSVLKRNHSNSRISAVAHGANAQVRTRRLSRGMSPREELVVLEVHNKLRSIQGASNMDLLVRRRSPLLKTPASK